MMNMRRISAALALTLVLTFLLGCLGGFAPQSTASSLAQASTAQKDTTPITLTAFSNYLKSPENWEWGQDLATQEITKLTGVTLDITFASTNDNTELNTMLAAGVNIPDFIVATTGGNHRNMIVNQGFALPLNLLADKYCPEFWDVLPPQEDIVYQEADGNFYLVTYFFDDVTQTDIKLNPNLNGSLAFDQEMYNEMGRPEIKTVDDYVAHLVDVKNKYPELTTVFWERSPASDALDIFRRMYGAKSKFVTDDGESVAITYKTDYHYHALKLYNRLFQEGLVNPEIFTYKTEQHQALAQGRQFYAYAGKFWHAESYNGDPNSETYEAILTPMPEGMTLEELHLPSIQGGIGGSRAVYISSSCKDEKRAIEYVTFMLSKEGQELQRHGVKGVTWEPDEDGIPVNNQTFADAEAKGGQHLHSYYGAYNLNFGWFATNAIINQAAHYVYQAYPSVKKDFELNSIYCYNERIYNLATSLAEEEDRVLQTQINDIASRGEAAIIFAKNDDEFESLYAKMMSDLNTAGIDRLEEIYKAQYASWKEKLN